MCIRDRRSINVGGHRVTNEQLAATLASAGVATPTPYQASGNVFFSGDLPATSALEQALEGELGYVVPLTVRNAEELRAIAAAEPFDSTALASSVSKPQVILLLEGEADAAAVHGLSTEDDLLVGAGRQVFWLPKLGVSGTVFDPNKMAAAFGVNTVRTQATIQRLVKKLA